MKIKEHFKSFCSFWKPSVARRITLYFLIFGLIIFFATSFFFTVGARKHFMRSTSKVIHHQFAQLEGSTEPDFIWYGINHSRPELYNLMAMLESISASFYRVSDISIYSKDTGNASWSRLYFAEDKILRASPIDDSVVEELNKTTKIIVDARIKWKFPINLLSLFVGNKMKKGIAEQMESEILELKRICEM